MNNFRLFISILIFISLSACKVTGEAEDQFDEEDKEPKIGLGNIGIFKSKTKKENEELRARLERLEQAQQTGQTPVYQPAGRPGDITAPPVGGGNRAPLPLPQQRPTISPEDAANFEEWKRARARGSSDYKDFKEYQEWLEFKKLQEQKK